jgi:transposase
MLSRETRISILKLKEKGLGKRKIAELLDISKNSVKKVLKERTIDIPPMEREELLDNYKSVIVELKTACKGNLVRVHEKLNDLLKKQEDCKPIAYSTLTGYCRRNQIGIRKKIKSSGEYHFPPGEEMQHDTSPHTVMIGGRKRKLQCASVVLCFSRMIYIQIYETFNRFLCKVFLTDAIKHFNGAANSCMIDNTHVIVAHGSGKNATMAPEMVAFGKRFGMTFNAHRIGDANRSARVERPFRYIENNFYPGREFKDLKDLNVQAIEWCHKNNLRYRKRLMGSPVEIYQHEVPYLHPLPVFIPDVEALHHRSVGLDGYVYLHSNYYSVPDDYIGHSVRIRETKETVQIFNGQRLLAEHKRREHGAQERSRIKGHSHKNHWSKKAPSRSAAEENTLTTVEPMLKDYISTLKSKYGTRSVRHIKKLYKLYTDYPTDAFIYGVKRAFKYGLLDMDSLEKIIIKNTAGNFFKLSMPDEELTND